MEAASNKLPHATLDDAIQRLNTDGAVRGLQKLLGGSESFQSKVFPMAAAKSQAGWIGPTLTIGVGIICALVGALYVSVQGELGRLNTHAERAAQGISDMRVDVATVKGDVSAIRASVTQILQRTPQSTLPQPPR